MCVLSTVLILLMQHSLAIVSECRCDGRSLLTGGFADEIIKYIFTPLCVFFLRWQSSRSARSVSLTTWTEFTSRERLRSPPRSDTPTSYASPRVRLQTLPSVSSPNEIFKLNFSDLQYRLVLQDQMGVKLYTTLAIVQVVLIVITV